MSERKDGGPAFPREDYQTDDAPGQRGMSLRDYFAARAMAALIPVTATNDLFLIAEDAYKAADAMLKARGR